MKRERVKVKRVDLKELYKELRKVKSRPFIIPCQLKKLYHKFKASFSLPSKKIAS